ncbi:TonB-dependent receptor [Cesiribacter andamanensis]|nr:TonB-dependent receptor [Cesiribacter andamanensis]
MLICFALLARGQQLQLIDQDSRQPIPGVSILNTAGTKGVVTDSEGRADITPFRSLAQLHFRHPAYYSASFSLQQLKEMDYVVALRENIVQIPEVVISANRWEQKQEEVPQQITAISGREIAFQNPATPADLLQQTGEVFVQKSQLGGGSPMLRGFAANSVLLVVDGIRMNNAIYRSGNLQNVISLDAHVLEGAEVIFGPGTVLYGSDALGGVLDFHTKSPGLATDASLRTEGSALLRWASASQEKTAHVDLALGSRTLASLSSISLSDWGDLRAGRRGLSHFPDYLLRTSYQQRIWQRDSILSNPSPHHQLGSGYSQLNLLQKLRWVPSRQWDLTYSFHYSNSSDIPRYDRLVQRSQQQGRAGELRFAEWYYGPQRWMLHSLQSRLQRDKGVFEEARLTAGYQRVQESRHSRSTGSTLLESQSESVDVLTLNADFNRPFAAGPTLFYGAEAALNWVRSTGSQTDIDRGISSPAPSRYGDLGNHSLALASYASLHYPLGERSRLTAGARLNWYQLESRFSTRFRDFPFQEIGLQTTALIGNLGWTYTPNPFRLSLLASTGFRAPNVDDMAKVFDTAPGILTVPNPRLGPEYSYNAEATLGLEKRSFRLSLTTYLSLLDGAIVRRPFQLAGQDSVLHQGERRQVQALVNGGGALLAGSSLSVRYSPLPQLLLSSTLTYSWGQELQSGNALRHNPPLFGQTQLRYQRKKSSVELQFSYNGGIKFADLAPEEQDKAYLYTAEGSRPWWIASLKGAWHPLKQLELQAGLENLLDTHYRPYSSGISAPGRNLYLSVRTHF